VLVGEIADELRSLLYQKALDLDVTIEALEIMPDHVQLFMSLTVLICTRRSRRMYTRHDRPYVYQA
jgi:REP element-mobilizing transposase RayT